MGLRYLNGRSWAEVTREERFFCLHLYIRIQALAPHRFVAWLNERHALGADASSTWELAYEACFYRDLRHLRGRVGNTGPLKRTFDLCFLSDDEILIVEAKAQQPFDDEQVEVFARDRALVAAETSVRRVSLLGLCSSRCVVPPSTRGVFDGPVLTWRELAALFGDDPVLLRADEIYQAPAGVAFGRNNASGRMTGQELVAAFHAGRRFFVGRGGGLRGAVLREDVASGRWRTQRYQTNNVVDAAPNANWFALAAFVSAVDGR